MIVSNFNPASAGAFPGVDLLARGPKAQQQDGGTSNFSDLLGAADRPDAPVAAARAARLPARPAAPASVREKSFECGTGSGEIELPTRQSGGAAVAESAAATVGLDDAPPLPRDPRLDDPAELALEAAAIALATVLLQKTQVALPLPVVVDEQQLQGGPQQGASQNPDEPVTAAATELQGSVSLPAALPAESLVQPLPSAPAAPETVPSQGKAPAVRVAVSRIQTPEQLQGATVSLGETTPAAGNVLSSIAPSIVLTAKLDQAVALASSGAGLPLPRQPDFVPAVAGRGALVAEGVQISAQPEGEVSQPSLNGAPEMASSGSESSVDAEFLASALPVDPAAAFFASRAFQPQPATKTDPLEVDTGEVEIGSEATEAERDSGLDTKSDTLDFARTEGQAASVEDHSKPVKSTVSGGGAPQAFDFETSTEAGSEVGTFGAEEGAVQREVSSVLARSEESSTPVTIEGDALSSMVSSPAELPGAAASHSGTEARPAHETASRPTVLPPVQAKASELFNVVQNALERARSENPSHLAVEITLEDGSSFGLEVRMNASGLQASFRSESQPLLKALENSWAGFLAKESADSKVVSAAFEGRSGFGEFSNNGSDAGERRQQFEDSASAAFLANQDGGATAPEKPRAEAARKNLEGTGGMALYA
jgi:hypothetical protein